MEQRMKWAVSAPSNIALIKYMGKSQIEENRPSNASLSWTLNHLRTFVELETSEADSWQLLKGHQLTAMTLSQKGQEKFLGHLTFLKNHWGLKHNFSISSANNFPSDCGLASSASSFAALTMAVYEAAKSLVGASETLESLASLSRRGSGSSCRSFFSPWSIWEMEGARQLELPQRDLLHATLVVESGVKEVSSSDAHRRVPSSLLYEERSERAVLRLEQLLRALKQDRWSEAREVCWAEFWDMHALFETSVPTFSYMTPDSLRLLRHLQADWQHQPDAPIVTMDAGANIHLLFKPGQVAAAEELLSSLPVQVQVIKSWVGAYV